MGFMKDKAEETAAAMQAGAPADKVGDLIMHALFEGPNDMVQNMQTFTEHLEQAKKK
ncbi:hypothetical protein [Streptomyces sp. NPDC059708]|uniref:hypothetical protein n=1 Tax=Streptomyces sp. NPDC059708 TaxID=3346916 RepID=UPI00369987BE